MSPGICAEEMEAVAVVRKCIDAGGKKGDRRGPQLLIRRDGFADFGLVAEPALLKSFGRLAVFGDLPALVAISSSSSHKSMAMTSNRADSAATCRWISEAIFAAQ